METDNEMALRIRKEMIEEHQGCEFNLINSIHALQYARRLRAEWQKQVEPDILDSLDWNRLISGERRALKPEHQGWFDKLYASPPTAPENGDSTVVRAEVLPALAADPPSLRQCAEEGPGGPGSSGG